MSNQEGPTRQYPEQTATPDGYAAEPSFQRFTDPFVRAAFLWAFPHRVRPNHLTFLRFLLIPVVLVLWYLDHQWWALAVFIVAIATDFIDGTMARTRDQITLLGTYIDPIADKLLIGAVLALVGWQYLVVQIMLAFIALELIMTALGASLLLRTRSARGSNVFGKIKMAVQSAALGVLLLATILDSEPWIEVALVLLWVSLALAVLSGSKQIMGVRARRRAADCPPEPGQD
jgi:CDP-diacylglycerol--glycerol-3-phosphate 3-phosphatidyltransferase